MAAAYIAGGAEPHEVEREEALLSLEEAHRVEVHQGGGHERERGRDRVLHLRIVGGHEAEEHPEEERQPDRLHDVEEGGRPEDRRASGPDAG